MSRPRRLAASLATIAILAAPAHAFAQSAGDDQYSDPLAGSTTKSSTSAKKTSSGSSKSASSSSSSSNSSSSDSLGQTPPTSSGSASGSGSGTSTGSASTATTATTTAPAAKGQLPNTGFDARLVALLGGAMLLGGIGLRLRVRGAAR